MPRTQHHLKLAEIAEPYHSNGSTPLVFLDNLWHAQQSAYYLIKDEGFTLPDALIEAADYYALTPNQIDTLVLYLQAEFPDLALDTTNQ